MLHPALLDGLFQSVDTQNNIMLPFSVGAAALRCGPPPGPTLFGIVRLKEETKQSASAEMEIIGEVGERTVLCRRFSMRAFGSSTNPVACVPQGKADDGFICLFEVEWIGAQPQQPDRAAAGAHGATAGAGAGAAAGALEVCCC